jgi:S-adenosylmethionine synthetase
VIEELHLAEDVLAGHPDRLADGIAERIVTEALAVDPLALVGVEVAVHRRKVFITGRVAAGGRPGVYGRLSPHDLTDWVRRVYQRAGYGNEWGFDWGHDVQVVTDLDLGPLSALEAGIRRFSDDQNIVAGHATGTAATAYLPPAPTSPAGSARPWTGRGAGLRTGSGRTGRCSSISRRRPDGSGGGAATRPSTTWRR